MSNNSIMLEVSARHVHLSVQDLETLFGAGYTLTKKKDLSQPGQFACEERVDITGPKKQLTGVSILGPVRPDTQVEISLTDARSIGVAAPVRESGSIEGTPGCTLSGPAGSVEINNGVIAAKRHIHLDPATAAEFELNDRDVVQVEVADSAERKLIFGDVVVRVSESFAPAMHIDTDEGNAAGLTGGENGLIL